MSSGFFTVDQLQVCSTETHQIMVRKLGFPVHAEGRESSAEAFLRGRACGSSSFQNPGLSTCKSNQLCMSMCHLNHFTTTEALNKATKMFQEHVFLGLGTTLASNPKSISGHTTFAEGPRKVRGSPKVNTGSIPMPLLPKSFLLSYGKPH